MDQQITQLYHILQKFIGLHRQLLDVVRLERQVLTDADLKAIEKTTSAKQALVEEIHQVESTRLKKMAELAVHWKKPYRELTLPNIIIAIQGNDPKGAEQLRSMFNTLTVLIQRITEQNSDNRMFIERSLEHVHQMKKNILSAGDGKSDTYTQQGQRASSSQASRLISKEA